MKQVSGRILTAAMKQLLKMLFFITVLTVLLFATSGRPDWLMGWIYAGIYACGLVVTTALMLPRSPELLAERINIHAGSKKWDRLLAPLMATAGPGLTIVTAGLDMRFGWSPHVALPVKAGASAFAVLAYGLLAWSMVTNRFFSAVVRIQTDRGHTVISSGPYRIVRHPGYTAMTACLLCTPLMLGSLWAFVPALATLIISLVRTLLEDRTLQMELAGYRDYTRRVPYLLVPGIW